MARTTGYPVIGRIVSIKRVRGSVNGNPRFELRVECADPTTGEPIPTGEGRAYIGNVRTILTKPNTMMAYGIKNLEWTGTPADRARGVYPLIKLTVDGRGNAYAIERYWPEDVPDQEVGEPINVPESPATEVFEPNTQLLRIMADGHRARKGHALTGYWTGTELRELHRTCCS